MCTSVCQLAIVLSTVLVASTSMVNIHVTVLNMPAITIVANDNTTMKSFTRQLHHPELMKVLLRPYHNTTSIDLESDIWNRNSFVRLHHCHHNNIISIKFWELTKEAYQHYSLRQYIKHNYSIDLIGLLQQNLNLVYDKLPSCSDIMKGVQDQLNNVVPSLITIFWNCFTVALFVLVIAYVVLLIALIVLQSLCVLCIFASLISSRVLQRDTLPVTVASFFILLSITSQEQTKILLRDIGTIMKVAWVIIVSIRKVPSKISEVVKKVLFGITRMERQTEKEVEEGDLYFDAQEQFEEDESVVSIESLVDEVFSQDEDSDTVDTARVVIDGFVDMVDNTELDAFGSFARSEVDATLEATLEVVHVLQGMVPPIKTRYGRIIRKPSRYSDCYCSISQQKPSRKQ